MSYLRLSSSGIRLFGCRSSRGHAPQVMGVCQTLLHPSIIWDCSDGIWWIFCLIQKDEDVWRSQVHTNRGMFFKSGDEFSTWLVHGGKFQVPWRRWFVPPGGGRRCLPKTEGFHHMKTGPGSWLQLIIYHWAAVRCRKWLGFLGGWGAATDMQWFLRKPSIFANVDLWIVVIPKDSHHK